jgi:serine/threonine-protein kinase
VTAVARLTEGLAGRYRIDRELGAGGMATVYLAHDLRHHRRVALKVVREELSAGLGSERFLREIRLAAGLHHPNILPLYDSGEAGGNLYYVMPVAEGESLRDRIQRDGTIPVGDAVRLAGEVAGALDYAHRHEVVHRDIKPENILLHDGHALITDFGIGKALSSADAGATLTQIGLAVGTPAYMSPEQAGGETSLDGRSDLYSLGCVLYEMLTGTPPFTGSTVQAVIAKRFTEPPPDATVARSSVPRAVADVARKLMATERPGRYATGAEAAEALARCVTPGNTLVVERDSGAERARSSLPWIAVLPFASRDSALAEFAEGLAEGIATGLSCFSYLQVVSSHSVAHAGSAGTDVQRAARDLGARFLIEGSLRKSGTTIRVNAQLIDVATGTHLWAEAFDRDLGATTIFAIQDELTDRIVATVADPYGFMMRAMAQPLRERPVEELTAAELVVRAYGYGHQIKPDEHARLRAGFELAVEREPGNANAWALLSKLYWNELGHGLNPLPDPIGRSLRAARRAVDADPTCQLAWQALAEAYYFAGDIDSFRPACEKSLALNPRNTDAGSMFAMLIAFSGDWERGLKLNERMQALNPHHPGWYWFVPFHYHFHKGEYAQALAAAKRVNMPELIWTHTSIALAAAEVGLWDEVRVAVTAAKRLLGTEKDIDWHILARGWIHDRDYVELQARSWRKAVEGLRAPQPAATVKSIAVLPFANMSAAAEDEYFADGMTEEIINALAQVHGLKVTARTSCFAFKGRNEDLRVVAEKLGVQTLLEGSVRKSGSRVRITAQLINAADGCHLWSERYDRELTDVFALQDELACAIAGKLQLSLMTAEPGRTGPRNVEAYELLLKGRVLLGQRGRAILDAIPCFERAVRLDPELAEAHALAGDACRLLAMYGMAPSTEMMPRARAAAERALALDPNQVEAIATLAGVTATYDGDIAASSRLTDRALALDPAHVRALCERAAVLSMRELTPAEMDRVLSDVRTARRADPLNSWAAAIEAMTLAGFGRLDEALRAAGEAIDLDPAAFTGHWTMVWILAAADRSADGLAAAEPALRMSGRSPLILVELAAIHAQTGDRVAAEAIHQELQARARTGYISPSILGAAAAAAGHRDQARSLVARGIEARDTALLFWKSPAWAPFRADPEGLALLQSAGLGLRQQVA